MLYCCCEYFLLLAPLVRSYDVSCNAFALVFNFLCSNFHVHFQKPLQVKLNEECGEWSMFFPNIPKKMRIFQKILSFFIFHIIIIFTSSISISSSRMRGTPKNFFSSSNRKYSSRSSFFLFFSKKRDEK